MEVWDHYDNDSEDDNLWRSGTIMIMMVRMIVMKVLDKYDNGGNDNSLWISGTSMK